MFQSSRIASGICFLQTSRATLPSSASKISKSRSWRILRATMRTTRESSTTRKLFMIAPSCRFVAREIEQSVDVEDHEQLLVESEDTERHLAPAGIESRRVALEL